jgi:oligopeptidase B
MGLSSRIRVVAETQDRPLGVVFGAPLRSSTMYADAPSTSAAPIAKRQPTTRTHHGDVFIDPYEWLRDKENPEVISYLEAENAYTEAQTAHLSDLSDAIFGEIKARTKETDLSVPSYSSHPGGSAYWYYIRTVEGSEYPIYCRVVAHDRHKRPDPEHEIVGEEVLLDCNLEAEGHEFFALGAFSVSLDGRLLAYSIDVTGAERFTIMIKDLVSGDLLADQISDTAYGVAWAKNSHFFYTRADDAWRPYVILRHRLGTDPAHDVAVVTEPDERFWLDVDASRDDQWIIIGAASKITSEVRLLSTDDPEGEPRIVAPRREGVEYDAEPAGDRLLIVHNDGAEDFELAEAPLSATSHAEWRPVIPHRQGVRILAVSAYASHAVVSLRRDGLTGLHVMPRDDQGSLQPGQDIGFDESLYVVYAPGESEYVTATIRISYASMLTADSVYDYDFATRELTLLKRTPVLDDSRFGPYQPDHYVQERGWATALDGTQVPLSIVRRRDVPLDGSAPALLYGYGSYEASMDPSFSISRLSLLDRGIVYAIAHIRGGGELGRSWYEQGKKLAKMNTFTDFIACADYLVEHGYTSRDRLAARGGSAGGLLMGAVANLAPEKFGAIHAAVPFVDALNTILKPELPLTVTEWEEWGDPLHDPQVYEYMKSYAPYENVRPVDYPAILATTSLNDTRVFYVEPAKWVAALRHALNNSSERQLLLKTEMVAGHGGVSGRYKSWRELAFEYAWIIGQIASND